MKQPDVPVSSDPGSAGKFVLATVLSFLLNAAVVFSIFLDTHSALQFGGLFVAQLIINMFLAIWFARDREYPTAAGIVAGLVVGSIVIFKVLASFWACHWAVSGCSL